MNTKGNMMDFILAKIYCLRLIRAATIATFLIMLGLGINMFSAQANDSEHYMFMHDLNIPVEALIMLHI